MPEFYAEHNLRRHFTAPQFTRSRHRFRGARESEKVNLEMDQLYYSIHKLYQIQDNFQDHFIQRATILLEGGHVEGVTGWLSTEDGDILTTEDGDDLGTESIMLDGLETIANRVDALRRRVKALEA